MAKLTYGEQLKHPNWQRKRLEVMEAAGFQCENCGDKDSTLNVHHRRYVKGRMVWEYERQELTCLCESCHRQEHVERELLDLVLMTTEGSAVNDAIGLLGGFLDGDLLIEFEIGREAERIGARLFDVGVLASILHSFGPEGYLRAVEALKPPSFTPSQEAAIQRWRDFAALMEASGL